MADPDKADNPDTADPDREGNSGTALPGMKTPVGSQSAWCSPAVSPRWSRAADACASMPWWWSATGRGRSAQDSERLWVIPDAVRKGNAVARRGLVTIPLRRGTIPQQITVKKGATIVLIKPAREGTGVIAAGGMRAILELGGVKDVVGKSLGSRNPINIVYATIEALRQLRDPETEMAKRTGRTVAVPAAQ